MLARRHAGQPERTHAAWMRQPMWVWPWWMVREVDPRSTSFIPSDGSRRVNLAHQSWTPVGNLGRAPLGVVDPAGLVTPGWARWSLDWWIGADDRWHVPPREPSLRQRLVDDMPVVETRVRVPGGDAVHRVYAVPGEPERLVVEVENDSSVPFAVAFAIRPYDGHGVTEVEHVRIDGETAWADGAAVVLPRAPSFAAAGSFDGVDPAAIVMRGDASTGSDAEAWCRLGLASAAAVLALPHRASLSVTLPATAPATGGAARAAMAPPGGAAAAVRGWRVVGDRGVQISVPDARLEHALAAARRHLLVGYAACPPGAARAVAAALRAVGYDPEAGEAAVAAQAAEALGSAELHALPAAAPVLDEEGLVVTPAGVDLIRTLDLAARDLARGDQAGYERLNHVVDRASATWTWPDVVHPHLGHGCGGDGASLEVAARVVTTAVGVLLSDAAGGLDVLPVFPATWAGHPVEVQRAPTSWGAISYALRWHGERPALLWEVDGAPPNLVLRCPGLDATFATTEPKGEALLVASAATGG